MASPICVFVHVEDGELDVGDEKPLLGSLLLDVLHKGVFFCPSIKMFTCTNVFLSRVLAASLAYVCCRSASLTL